MSGRAYEGFGALPPSYHELFSRSAEESFYCGIPWFRNLAENALPADERVCIYGIEQGAAPLAALVMRYSARSLTNWIGPRRLSALSNYYSTFYAPIFAQPAGDVREPVAELARAVTSDTRRWDVVDLAPLDAPSPVFDEFVRAFRAAGRIVQTYFFFGNWYSDVAGRSYQDYFKSLPSNLQNTISRKAKKLAKQPEARIEMVTGAEGLEAALRAYQEVYERSWKTPEPYPQFIPSLARACAAAGALRLGIVYVGNEPIAAQLWIVSGRKATIYKLAHDERFAELSAGTVLNAKLLEHVLDVDKVREVDFGRGDDSYKKNWLPQRRERWGILAFHPRTLHGMMGILRHVGGRTVKTGLGALLSRFRSRSGGSGHGEPPRP